jgi:outer membrane protein
MKQVTIAIVLLFSSFTIFAQDLLEVYSEAKTQDPQFQAAGSAYQAIKESIPQARAALLPGVVLTARAGDIRQKTGEQAPSIFGSRDADQRYSSTSYNIEANQPLFRYGDWVALRQAHASVRRGFALYTAEEQDLIRRTASAYIVVLAARDTVNFAKAEQAAVGRQLKLVKARRRGGLANSIDEQEALARFSRVEANVIEADFILDDAFEGLMEIVGYRVRDVDAFSTDFPLVAPVPADVDHWLAQAQKNNLSLIAANETVLVAMEEINRGRSSHYPTLDLVVRHGNVDSDQKLSEVTGSGNDVNTTEVALEMSMPLYAGGAIRSVTRQAMRQHDQALSERDRQYRLVARETRAAYQAIVRTISRVEALRTSVKAQNSVLTGKTKGFSSGVNTLFEVLDAESDLYSTKRELANAGYDYLLNMLRLKQQVGNLAESDLEAINNLVVMAQATD